MDESDTLDADMHADQHSHQIVSALGESHSLMWRQVLHGRLFSARMSTLIRTVTQCVAVCFMPDLTASHICSRRV